MKGSTERQYKNHLGDVVHNITLRTLSQIYDSFVMLKLLENMFKICNETIYLVVYNKIKLVYTIKSLCYIMKHNELYFDRLDVT